MGAKRDPMPRPALARPSVGLTTVGVVPMVLALGILAGLLTAAPVAQLGIPSFVASLAGWLIYRGLLQLVTEGTGTISITDPIFVAFGNGFIPDLPMGGLLEGIHKLTLLLGLAAIGLFINGELSSRRKKLAYGFEVLPSRSSS